jgi:uncharacterized protein with NRDE domain
MCLIALALEQHRRWPLVIAANRDEFLHRPAAALDWWRPAPAAAPLLGGRDLQAGGTWMGLAANGRLAMLTNVRDLARHQATAPSRGRVVPEWLATPHSANAYWRQIASRRHNPSNLLAADIGLRQWWWADDQAGAPQALGPGLYGLSNAALDTPWPKVRRLKQALAEAIDVSVSLVALEAALFAALADRSAAPDDALPDTGVGLERERWFAPAFIRTPDGRYGTRCSTLLIGEPGTDGLGVHVIERVFNAAGRAVTQRRASLPCWPLPAGEPGAVRDEPLTPG